MTKEKKSFIERLTGSRKYQGDEERFSPTYSESDMEETPMEMSPSQSLNQNDDWNDDSEGQLTIDVYQTDNDVVIKSTIAGVKPEDLDISINNDVVTIKGERKNEEMINEEHYYYQECYWGQFSRSVVLPVDVISEKAEASLKNGILTLRIPKADVNKTKRIQVRGF